jgi:WD40 repeat protein
MKTLLAAPSTPYKGLAPYSDSDLDAFLFFGRERDRDVIVANLIAARLTVLYGVSGVGKSSVLRAGVAYHLREVAREQNGRPEHAVAVVDAWASDPIDVILETVGASREGTLDRSLEAWTRQHDAMLYLILDQFEEYFVYHGDDDGGPLRDELADVLTDRSLRVNLLFSLREDALAQLDAFKGRIPNLFANSLRLDRLDRRAARAAMVGPVDRYNELVPEDAAVAIEPELVEAVLDEVTLGRVDLGTTDRGELPTRENETGIEAPYLQLVMERIWGAERDAGSHVLRLATLRRLGGAVSIVRSHLERALDILSPEQRDVAASVFNHLVTPSGTKIALRAGDLAEYASVRESDLLPVLGSLGRERIVRVVDGAGSGAARYEIFHDVLGDAVLAWRARHASEARLARERRRQRRALAVVLVALVGFAVMTAIAVYALAQRSEARNQASIAHARAAEAHARELHAKALLVLDINPQQSLQLAYRAALAAPDIQSESVLRRALLASRLRLVLDVGAPLVDAWFSPLGRWILAAGANGQAKIFDARKGRLLRLIRHRAPLRAASISPDGRLILTAGSDGRARLWQPLKGKLVRTLVHGPPIRAASFATQAPVLVTAGGRLVRVWSLRDGALMQTVRLPVQVRDATLRGDGRYVVTVAADHFARAYDVVTGRLLHTFDQGGRVTSASFSPSGALIVTSGTNRSVRTWSVQSGRHVLDFGGFKGPVLAAVVDPRGRLLAAASADGTARVWEIGRGALLSQLIGHATGVTGLAFAPTGFSIVTTSQDRTARVWQPSNGTPRAVLAGHTAAVTSAAFSPDSSRVVTASEDGTARVWDPQTDPNLVPLGRYGRHVSQIALSPDGRLLIVGTDHGALLVEAASGVVVRMLLPPAAVRSVAFSRDGARVAAALHDRIVIFDAASGRPLRSVRVPRVTAVDFGLADALATGSADGTLRFWTSSGSLVRTLRKNDNALTSVHFDRSGARVVTGSEDRTARVWDVRTGRELLVLRGHSRAVTSARFSPDGRFVITASADHDARIWNVSTGKSRAALTRHLGLVSDAEYSPDGRFIVTAGPQTAGVWDARDNDRFLFFLHAPVPWVTTALFQPDSERILTAGRDGTVRTYRCDVCGRLPSLIALAKRRLAAAAR